jgi:alkanesulfonate monooxygenase SsuD/methylene tetrahydromethanopterin reductase-like flavin-dependent oxidoreductase (luciferase family)
MKFGVVVPFADARQTADLAQEAERAGWDGVFVWEPVWGTDAWVSLAAAAMQTERIRLGTMLSPLPWLSPLKLASETATLDQLSNGRVILAVGLGANDAGAADFGLELDRKQKAERLDEGLAILNGLWAGQPFAFEGKHHRIRPTEFSAPPPPVQQPRMPIWCVGVWPRMKSMRRVLGCDGILPTTKDAGGNHRPLSQDEIRAVSAWLAENSAEGKRFDIVVEGETPADEPNVAASMVRPQAEAGATWWMETRWMAPRNEQGLAIFRDRVRAGPPRL